MYSYTVNCLLRGERIILYSLQSCISSRADIFVYHFHLSVKVTVPVPISLCHLLLLSMYFKSYLSSARIQHLIQGC